MLHAQQKKMQTLHQLFLLKPTHPPSFNCRITEKYFILLTTQIQNFFQGKIFFSSKYRCAAQTKYCISKQEFNHHWQTGLIHFPLSYWLVTSVNLNIMVWQLTKVAFGVVLGFCLFVCWLSWFCFLFWGCGFFCLV